MTARITHKRGATLRWDCQRMTDPPPGSGEEAEPLPVSLANIRAAIRDESGGFYEPLEVRAHPIIPEDEGGFSVFAEGQMQADWPIGDLYFDFVFIGPGDQPGDPETIDKTQTGVIHIQREQTEWP